MCRRLNVVPPIETEDELRHEFLLTGIASGPAKPDEIDALEQTLGFKLPIAYRAYLRVCGTHPPAPLIGSDCTMGLIPSINEWGDELVAENNVSSKFPDKFFVYLMHQGYTFLWFPLDGSDDPPCYCYLEGDDDSKPASDKFSLWVRRLSWGSGT